MTMCDCLITVLVSLEFHNHVPLNSYVTGLNWQQQQTTITTRHFDKHLSCKPKTTQLYTTKQINEELVRLFTWDNDKAAMGGRGD